MTARRPDDMGQQLARELQRIASSRPVDVLDAGVRLEARVARDRNRARVAIAAILAVVVSTTVLFLIERRQRTETLDRTPPAGMSVAVVSRASEPQGPDDVEWSLLQAARSIPQVSSVQWEPAGSYVDGARALDTAAANATVVVLSGPDLQAFVPEAARNHPRTEFVVLDGPTAISGAHAVNIGGEQAAFLAGALAAAVSANGRLGVVFGGRLDSTEALTAGFVAGAREVDPDVRVEVRYVTRHPDLSGFGDQRAQESAARELYTGGADVVFGNSAIGVAAQMAGDGQRRWAIGVDADPLVTATADEAEVVLTSVVKDVPGALQAASEVILSSVWPVVGRRWVSGHRRRRRTTRCLPTWKRASARARSPCRSSGRSR